MIIRQTYLDKLIGFKDVDLIKIITGVRRSGKSVLLMQYRDWLLSQGIKADAIVYINFEDYDYQRIQTDAQLRHLFDDRLTKSQRYYILLDEIQNVEDWQRVVNGVRVSFDCDIIITGSNASMLSGELATLIAGRYVELPIYPLSFKEFLAAKAIDPQSRAVDQAFREYQQFGGFPITTLVAPQLKDQVLQGIYDTILLNDVATRGSIRDISVLRGIVGFLADNAGQLINAHKIASTLQSEHYEITTPTVQRYMNMLEQAFLFYRVQQYDLRGRQFLRTTGKYFAIDPGLRRVAVSRRDGNFAGQLENIVFIELLRRGYEVSVGKIDRVEIDFVARRQDETLYVQVAYQLPENSHETDNLLLIHDNFSKIVITQRYPEQGTVDGIPIINIVDWLLE